MRVYRQKRRKKKSKFVSFLQMLLSFVLVVSISYVLALVWHTSQQMAELQGPEEDGGTGQWQAAYAGQEEADGDDGAAVSTDWQGISRTRLDWEETARESVYGSVPVSTRVSDSYFDDAIFFGDSISTGIPLYHVADNAAVVAMTGLDPINALTRKAFPSDDGESATMLEYAQKYGEREKVYILMGCNAVGSELADFIAGYESFLDAVKAQYPKATVYVQSMTPVTDTVQKSYPALSNQVIEEYNAAILQMCLRKGVYYLDIAAALVDEEDKLPLDASPVDGLHFTPEYYYRWFAYLKTHTV